MYEISLPLLPVEHLMGKKEKFYGWSNARLTGMSPCWYLNDGNEEKQ